MLMTNVDSARQPLGPRHPVRDRPHVDRRQHRLRRASRGRARPSPRAPTGRNRMFWLTAERDRRPRRTLDQVAGVGHRQGERLLGENARAAGPCRVRPPGGSGPAARPAARPRRGSRPAASASRASMRGVDLRDARAGRRPPAAVAGLRDAMATGLNPALRYATRWQSRMMNPAPTQPIRQSLRAAASAE